MLRRRILERQRNDFDIMMTPIEETSWRGPICIRDSRYASKKIVKELGEHLWKEWSEDYIRYGGMKSAADRARVRRGRYTFVAYNIITDEFVGTCSIDVKDGIKLNLHKKCAWLCDVYVCEGYRSVGLGLSLCRHALEFAREVLGVSEVRLWTSLLELEEWYVREFGFELLCVKLVQGSYREVRVLRLALNRNRHK